MEMNQILKNTKLKKKLEQKRQKMIRQRLKNKQKQQINSQKQEMRIGKIQKTKIIKKKQYETYIQKSRFIPVELQGNVNSNTFLNLSSSYSKVLKRTKKIINFEEHQLIEVIKAIQAYGRSTGDQKMSIIVNFKNKIQCNEWPCQILLKNPEKHCKCLIICDTVKELDQQIQFQSLTRINCTLISLNDFIKKNRDNSNYLKKLKRISTKIFCQFKIYQSSKFISKLLKQNIIIFPIDTVKIPYILREKINSFEEYINYLIGHQYTILKSGFQHYIKINLNHFSFDQLQEMIKQISWQLVAKLINRSNNKQHEVSQIALKTNISIPITIYKNKQ